MKMNQSEPSNSNKKLKYDIMSIPRFCPKGNLSMHVCANQICQSNAFVCQKEDCQCRLSHNLCMELNITQITDNLFEKIIPLTPIITTIQKQFDTYISELQTMQQKILQQFKSNYQFYGLDINELKFIKSLQSANIEQIPCSLLGSIVFKTNNKKQDIKHLQETQKDIKNLWRHFDKKIKKLNQKIDQLFGQIRPTSADYLLTSKIITKRQDWKNLISFFPKGIKQIKLLYRASQNNFKIKKFHSKCDNQSHTLTICETSFDKVIGGYTALEWNQNNNLNVSDPQERSFLFSVTNNEKIHLTQNKQKQICCDKNYGPIFGEHDLCILDKANQCWDSYTNIGYSYKDEEYEINNPESSQKFAGGIHFKLKQWEVWKVVFQQ